VIHSRLILTFLLSITAAALVSLTAGIDPRPETSSPHAYLEARATHIDDDDDDEHPSCAPVFDFETGADGSQLHAGDLVNEQWDMIGIHVTTHDPRNHPSMIFDSGDPTGGDWDLGTPNETFGGPGLGDGGRQGMAGQNKFPLGNVLIISEDGSQDNPDDNANGGVVIFTFDSPVTIQAVGLLDVDLGENHGMVTTFDAVSGGTILSRDRMQNLGSNGVQCLKLNVGDGVSEVLRLK